MGRRKKSGSGGPLAVGLVLLVGLLAAVSREVWIFIGLTIVVVGVYSLYAQHRKSKAEAAPVVPERTRRAVLGANQAHAHAYRQSAVVEAAPALVEPAC